MQKVLETLHEKSIFLTFLFLGLFDGDFPELLEVLHKIEGYLAGAGAGGFVTLNDLGASVLLESGGLSDDFFDKLFHFYFNFRVNMCKITKNQALRWFTVCKLEIITLKSK